MSLRRAFALLLLSSSPAVADGFLLFQHGGRGAAQAGAFVARADEPSAVRYNPAALVRLGRLEYQAGLDFQAPYDEFSTSGRVDSPEHVIQFPPAIYVSWKPENLAVPLAFGLSLDAPIWTIEDWDPAGFPARFDTSRQKLALYELRPTVAWALDERWSLGGSLRYVRGDLETSFSSIELFSANPNLVEPGEVIAEAATDVDGLGFDLAVHFDGETWGAGLVASSGISLEADGEVSYSLRDPLNNPGPQLDFDLNFGDGDARLDFELPPKLTAGFWWGATPNLALEADVAWSGWSALDRTKVRLSPEPFADDPPALDRRRDWDDTLAIRLGAEMRFGDGETGWSAGGGLAWEPSPVPDATIEPGFPRGDAYVVALGGSYNLEGLSFDLGYSYYIYEDRDAVLHSSTPTGAFAPVTGTFSARAQVFSFSARWRK